MRPPSWDPACAGETHVFLRTACSRRLLGSAAGDNTSHHHAMLFSTPKRPLLASPGAAGTLLGSHPSLPNARSHKPPRMRSALSRRARAIPHLPLPPCLPSAPALPQQLRKAGARQGFTSRGTRRAAAFGVCGRAGRGEGRAGGVRGLGRGWYLQKAPGSTTGGAFGSFSYVHWGRVRPPCTPGDSPRHGDALATSRSGREEGAAGRGAAAACSY